MGSAFSNLSEFFFPRGVRLSRPRTSKVVGGYVREAGKRPGRAAGLAFSRRFASATSTGQAALTLGDRPGASGGSRGSARPPAWEVDLCPRARPAGGWFPKSCGQPPNCGRVPAGASPPAGPGTAGTNCFLHAWGASRPIVQPRSCGSVAVGRGAPCDLLSKPRAAGLTGGRPVAAGPGGGEGGRAPLSVGVCPARRRLGGRGGAAARGPRAPI